MAKRAPPVRSRKQPLGVEAKRKQRAARGRTTAVETPVEIRAPGMQLSAALEPYVREKLGAKLGLFALQIERVSVRFRDINGPRGGEDTECRIQVALGGRPDVVVHHLAAGARRSFDGANKSVARAVKRDLERAGWSQGLGATQRRARGAAKDAEPGIEPRGSRPKKSVGSKPAVRSPKGRGKPKRPSSRR